MSVTEKYTPDPRLAWIRGASMAVHVVVPLVAVLFVGRAHPGFPLGLMAFVAYLGYLLFAIVLHKEFYPERVVRAAWLLALPLACVAVIWPGGVAGFFACGGTLLLTALELAVFVVCAAGTHLRVGDEARAPGEGGLQWVADGHSFWSDPTFSPMMRWSVTLAFFVVGAVGIAVLHVWVAAPAGLFREPLLVGWWIVALAASTYLYVRQFAGLTAGGRFFGPGRRSFE